MIYPVYIILGILPSIIWLVFFLKKDSHPESNRMIVKIFLLGMLAAIPAFLIELGLSGIFSSFENNFLTGIIYVFLGIALVEELLKYLVVRDEVFSNPEFDEPVDTMLYMIIAALGFAALENILYVFNLDLTEAFLLTSFRFVGAVFLHALCSAIFGYFLALSFIKPRRAVVLFISGFLIAVALHGLFNFSIIMLEGVFKLISSIIILTFLALVVLWAIKNLKETASVCKIK